MTSGVGGAVTKPLADTMAAEDALFPPAERRRHIDNWLTDALIEARLKVHVGSVNSEVSAAHIADALEKTDLGPERSAEDVLQDVIDRMRTGLVHVDHRRYFGLFNPTPTFLAQCADRIVAAFNPQLATATTSPYPVALEAWLIKVLAKRARMPEATTGHFTSGGSEANFTALVCALTRANPRFGELGAASFAGPPRVYVSSSAHLAWLKIAHQVGIGRAAIRLVETDGAGRMNTSALAQMIATDIGSGAIPVMIVCTAGTTGAGVIDPIGEVASIARTHGAWYHIDAAWAGALIVSDRHRHLLSGIELADSLIIDGHKWFATTMGCGIFFTVWPEILSNVFHVVMDCMPSNNPGADPYVTSAQWSRRFLGLRLFIGLAVAGWKGYADHVDRAMLLADTFAERMRALKWRHLNPSATAVVCLSPPPGSVCVYDIARAVVKEGIVWVSAVEFLGETAIRVCITSGECRMDDIATLIDVLCKHANAA